MSYKTISYLFMAGVFIFLSGCNGAKKDVGIVDSPEQKLPPPPENKEKIPVVNLEPKRKPQDRQECVGDDCLSPIPKNEEVINQPEDTKNKPKDDKDVDDKKASLNGAALKKALENFAQLERITTDDAVIKAKDKAIQNKTITDFKRQIEESELFALIKKTNPTALEGEIKVPGITAKATLLQHVVNFIQNNAKKAPFSGGVVGAGKQVLDWLGIGKDSGETVKSVLSDEGWQRVGIKPLTGEDKREKKAVVLLTKFSELLKENFEEDLNWDQARWNEYVEKEPSVITKTLKAPGGETEEPLFTDKADAEEAFQVVK